MRRTTAVTASLLALSLVTTSLAAQAHPMVGTWSVSYAAGMRHEGGVATVITGTGTLAVEQQGDSLVATLTPNPVDDQPARPPVRMAARATSGEVTFTSRSTAQLEIGGEVREAISVSTYALKVDGDKLEGTVARRLEGVDDLPIPPLQPAPFTGTRK